MKKTIMLSAALFVIAPLAAQASCESVRDAISHKIVQNGVPESGFKLDIVPNDQLGQAGGQVVGHCENDSQKIVYTRFAEGEAPAESAPATHAPQ
ncbi:DUF1161 domain-containing protein [Lonsdalea quercina]|uniref:DUF1161 domain-containing protein n=1 Tax=Lonsdalea quercina TaxID=71657 RepID=UPI003F4455C2